MRKTMGVVVPFRHAQPPQQKPERPRLPVPAERMTAERFTLTADGDDLPFEFDPRKLQGYRQP